MIVPVLMLDDHVDVENPENLLLQAFQPSGASNWVLLVEMS